MKLAALVVIAASASTAALAAAPAPVSRAVAALQPLGTSGVSGTVTFSKVQQGVKVDARLSGLSAGDHGFHVHEFGDCSANDGASAGGHFNPAAAKHAGPHEAARHAGDMGNIKAAADGTASLSYVDAAMSLDGPDGILGRGLIVHEKADDLKTQPTGNAGGRLACGVIGVAKAE
jgi:Cu-Zn family superoxide dismutase